METSKIVISIRADRDLEEMVAVVNDGFSSGRVKKGQLASWIVTFFKAAYFAKHVQTIRGDHFDEVAHLNSVIKQIRAAKKSDQTVEMDRLLSPLKESGKKTQRQPMPTQEKTPNEK